MTNCPAECTVTLPSPIDFDTTDLVLDPNRQNIRRDFPSLRVPVKVEWSCGNGDCPDGTSCPEGSSQDTYIYVYIGDLDAPLSDSKSFFNLYWGAQSQSGGWQTEDARQFYKLVSRTYGTYFRAIEILANLQATELEDKTLAAINLLDLCKCGGDTSNKLKFMSIMDDYLNETPFKKLNP